MDFLSRAHFYDICERVVLRMAFGEGQFSLWRAPVIPFSEAKIATKTCLFYRKLLQHAIPSFNEDADIHPNAHLRL